MRCLRSKTLLPLSALAMVAACGDDAAVPAPAAEQSASGEVQKGSISDAMLPLDSLKSQSPAAKVDPSSDGGGGSGGADTGTASQSANSDAQPEASSASEQASEQAENSDETTED